MMLCSVFLFQLIWNDGMEVEAKRRFIVVHEIHPMNVGFNESMLYACAINHLVWSLNTFMLKDTVECRR